MKCKHSVLSEPAKSFLSTGLIIALMMIASFDPPHLTAGDQQHPEITDPQGDQAAPGNGTQDIVAAWIQQQDNTHLLFSIKVASLAGVNANSGSGLPLDG